MVSEWAYVKELATVDTREGGEWGLLGSMLRGNVMGDRRKESVHSEKDGKNMTSVLVS